MFPTAEHLAASARLAPVTKRSGTSIRGKYLNRGGEKHLEYALFLAAFTSLRADAGYRAYYDRKRAEGKKLNAALVCLARGKTDDPFALITDQRRSTPSVPAPA